MLEALIGPVTGLLDKFIPDAGEKQRLAHEIATMSERHAQELAKGQIEINKAEAAHKSMFVAGWRPFVGWTCGVALAWHFIGQPIAVFVITHLLVLMPLRYLFLKWKACLQFCSECLDLVVYEPLRRPSK